MPADTDPLRDSPASYQALVEHIPQSVFIKSTDGVYLATNRCYASQIGQRPEDVIGRDDYAFFPRELADKYRSDDARVVASGEPFSCDESFTQGGRTLIVHTIKTPVRDGAGRVVGVCGMFWDVSEQRAMEERLRESEATLRSIYEQAQEGILVALVDGGRFVMANPAACRLLGYAEAELLRMRPPEVHPPELGPRLLQLRERLALGDFSLVQELPFRAKDGEVFYADVNPMTITMLGRPCHLMVLRDVSGKRLARDQLARSEAQLAEAQALAHLGNWNFDFVSGRSTWSDEEYRLLGFAPGSVQPSAALFLQAVHPEDRPAVEAALELSMCSGAPYRCEYRVQRPDGERVLEEMGEVKVDAAGRPVRMFGTTRDVTEQRRAAQALADSEQRFRVQIEHAPEAIVVLDADSGDFVQVNELAVRLFGASREQLLQCGPVTMSPPRQPDGRPSSEAALTWVREALAGGSPVFEWMHRRADGSDVLCEVRLVRLPSSQQRLVRGSMTDITARKQAERALKRANEDLEQRVQQRTAELLRAKLEAERANAAKSEFLSRMSHELRTPLNAILGFGQLMSMQERAPAQQDFLHEILKAGEHLLSLINEVLDLARIESGKFSVTREPVALGALLSDCLSLLRPQAQARGLAVRAAACDYQVWADPVRLKQVLLNLLSNAVKYNRPAGRVTVACQVLEDRLGPRLRVSVADTGTGLEPAQLARLFQPFERLEADRAAIEGTGIGLAIAKRLVELMEGRIGVDSRVGEGSVFWFELPLAPMAPSRAVERAPSPAVLETEPAGVPQRELLCIEDNPANLLLLENILALRPAHRLLQAQHPEQGLALARAHRPALILLDINLPGMDGYELLRRLRADPATCAIPVVAISANAKPDDLARGRAAGFDDYLTKPLDVARLLALVDALG